MNKLCCFPLSETPEMAVKVNCISTCCASETKTDHDSAKEIENESEAKVDRASTFCCGKKHKTFKSQAKEEEKEGN